MQPWLVVFDIDGTLVDSQKQIVTAFNYAFEQAGLTPVSREEILSIVGLSLPEAVAVLAPEISPEQRVQILDGYRTCVLEARANGTESAPLYDGARHALFALNARDELVLGAATGKAMRGLDHVIALHALDRVFVTKQTADLHPSKPHPAMLQAASAQTGIPPQRAIMIGDTSFDMEMGRAAGFATIGVNWGYHDRARLGQAADVIVDDFDALNAQVEKMSGGA